MSIYKRFATHIAGINDLKGAINYIFDPEKTCAPLMYGIGVEKMSAYEDMRFLKEVYCKVTGRQYLHWILSNDKGVPLETVETVNLEILRLLGNEFQVVAATHTNTDNLHTHFIINSVKIRDGRKFSESRRDMLRFRHAVNEILETKGLKSIGRTEDFKMSDRIEEVEMSTRNTPEFYQQSNVIWTQGVKPFVIEGNTSVGGQEEGLIRSFERDEELPRLIKPFTIGQPKLIKPFTIGESRLIKPFTIDEQKLVKPFTFEKEEKS